VSTLAPPFLVWMWTALRSLVPLRQKDPFWLLSCSSFFCSVYCRLRLSPRISNLVDLHPRQPVPSEAEGSGVSPNVSLVTIDPFFSGEFFSSLAHGLLIRCLWIRSPPDPTAKSRSLAFTVFALFFLAVFLSFFSRYWRTLCSLPVYGLMAHPPDRAGPAAGDRGILLLKRPPFP